MELYKLEFRRKWSKKVEQYYILAEITAGNCLQPLRIAGAYISVDGARIVIDNNECMYFMTSLLTEEQIEKWFNLNKPQHYGFVWHYGCHGPEIIVCQPTYVDFENRYMTMHFMQGLRSEAETVKFDDIIAIGSESGSHKIKGWSNSYTVINNLRLIQFKLQNELYKKLTLL